MATADLVQDFEPLPKRILLDSSTLQAIIGTASLSGSTSNLRPATSVIEGQAAAAQDALVLECHAFLTLDRKLAKNKRHLEETAGLTVLLPTEHWELLRPWAALW